MVGFFAAHEYSDFDDEWCDERFTDISYDLRSVSNLLAVMADTIDRGGKFSNGELDGIFKRVDFIHRKLAEKLENAWNKPKS